MSSVFMQSVQGLLIHRMYAAFVLPGKGREGIGDKLKITFGCWILERSGLLKISAELTHCS